MKKELPSSMKELCKKYQALHPLTLEDRTWPNQRLTKAPIWCSVDLRDGNQALVSPMNMQQKIEFFKHLVDLGFKEIEVGFPSAATIEYEFVRYIIENKLIPDDVHIQILTQAREHLIKRSLEAIQDCPNAIIHLYNSTSIAQRHYVFNKSKDEIIKMALQGIAWIKKHRQAQNHGLRLEYSPESFTGTEIDFSVEICNAVIDEWQDEALIINLPATVELFTPNVYADMIEYCSRKLKRRNEIILSVHTHNDRGTCTAASELALLAGADRVEGTLFGNGERTGNLDITTLALNLFMHGIDPKLKLNKLDHTQDVYSRCTQMSIPERHPYAGDLVFTAFSGSHQDAIKKGFEQYDPKNKWDVPYLTIDPQDIAKEYQAIIRINSQSGKGGVAYILEKDFKCQLPKSMQATIAKFIQEECEKTGQEIKAAKIWSIFNHEFVNRHDHLAIKNIHSEMNNDGQVKLDLTLQIKQKEHIFTATGNGPIDAAKKALESSFKDLKITDYAEHALSEGSDAQAICYLKIHFNQESTIGVGIDQNITLASLKALLSALNRYQINHDFT